ncbi:MAG: diguanylate cyclase [Armatimonadota bacterium]|nr:diguanylate cyclase [Armatimonadota bacterium]MDR7532754.1 diguanylate cyclase [Armatimonadota bacterium]MDR7537098.1 diguanylate cyclase [Armatimonadota bacterium]
MPHPLASLLDREQERVAAAWASALSRLRPSAFVYRPLEELRRLGRAYLTELVLYLDTDDPAGLRDFIRREAAVRLSMGFGAAEVVQGFVVFRELTQALCAEMVETEADRLALLERLTQATDFTIVEFVTHYQHLADQREAAHLKEMEDLQRALIDQAIQDEVTDLFTARFFEEHLVLEVKRAARYRRPFALVVLDVDEFEARHARYGPAVAQAALRAVAAMLRDLTRELDVKARTGETEFSVALPETGGEAALVVAERLRTRAAELPSPGRDEAAGVPGEALTVSVGLAVYPLHGETGRELHHAARRARDEAQLLGGNVVVQATA